MEIKIILEDEYFKSESHATIFYLLEMDGMQRAKKLGIEEYHYDTKEAALDWFNAISAKIDNKHPRAKEAKEKLNKIYKNMTDW